MPKYKDEYREALYQVIEAKLAGKEVVQVEVPAPITTDLSASLKASIKAILAAKEAVRV